MVGKTFAPEAAIRRRWPSARLSGQEKNLEGEVPAHQFAVVPPNGMVGLIFDAPAAQWRVSYYLRGEEAPWAYARGKTPRAALTKLWRVLPIRVVSFPKETRLGKRRRIYITRRGAHRLGCRPGFAYATMVYSPEHKRWAAEAIYRDGVFLGTARLYSGFRAR